MYAKRDFCVIIVRLGDGVRVHFRMESNMNEVDIRILGLYEKIKRTQKKTKEWKSLAGVSLFFAVCYCLGTKNIGDIDHDQVIASNIVWIASVTAIIFFYILDVQCLKNIKAYELKIYELELEDLKDKKELAEITGELLSDTIQNKQIEKPNEKVILPVLYYGILLGIDIVIRIYLFVNGII